jgi:hypothetical protein
MHAFAASCECTRLPRRANARIRVKRPGQSIFFPVNTAKDGLLRRARNDGAGMPQVTVKGLQYDIANLRTITRVGCGAGHRAYY